MLYKCIYESIDQDREKNNNITHRHSYKVNYSGVIEKCFRVQKILCGFTEFVVKQLDFNRMFVK